MTLALPALSNSVPELSAHAAKHRNIKTARGAPQHNHPSTNTATTPSTVGTMSLFANGTMNATLASSDTYFGIYNELSKYNVQLNIFERLWAVGYSPSPPLRNTDKSAELVCIHAE